MLNITQNSRGIVYLIQVFASTSFDLWLPYLILIKEVIYL